MQKKIQKFMYGRNGIDALGKLLLVINLVLYFLEIFIPWNNFGNPIPRKLFFFCTYIIFGIFIYRVLSPNITKRKQENYKYLKFKNKIISFFKGYKTKWQQRKIYHFYKCLQCHQRIRVPKGKGKIKITCPKCKNKFEKNS